MKKIILMFLCLIFILTGCGTKSISTSTEQAKIPSRLDSGKQSIFVTELYKTRGTKLSDREKINNIINTIPFFLFQSYDFEVEGNILKINYNIALRSEYRNKNELKKCMTQIALTCFSLISELQSCEITLKDVYGEFAKYNIDKSAIAASKGAEYFTTEIIDNATLKSAEFESYILKLVDMKAENSEYNVYYDLMDKEMNDMVLVDHEGAVFFDKIYTDDFAIKDFDVMKFAKENNIDMKQYIDKKIKVAVADAVNFKTGDKQTYIFIFRSESLIISDLIFDKELVISSLSN